MSNQIRVLIMNNKYFTKEKQRKALEWLEEKWKPENRNCEICGHTHWRMGEDLVTPITFAENGFIFGGNAYPCVLMMCGNCGNSKTFNAVFMNIERV